MDVFTCTVKYRKVVLSGSRTWHYKLAENFFCFAARFCMYCDITKIIVLLQFYFIFFHYTIHMCKPDDSVYFFLLP